MGKNLHGPNTILRQLRTEVARTKLENLKFSNVLR